MVACFLTGYNITGKYWFLFSLLAREFIYGLWENNEQGPILTRTPAILYGFEACGKISKIDMRAIKKIKNQPLKEILLLPATAPFTRILTKKGIWTEKQRTEYSAIMLIHGIINTNKERISEKIILEQKKKGMPIVLCERAKKIGESIRMNSDQAGKMKKSTLRKEKLKLELRKRYNKS